MYSKLLLVSAITLILGTATYAINQPSVPASLASLVDTDGFEETVEQLLDKNIIPVTNELYQVIRDKYIYHSNNHAGIITKGFAALAWLVNWAGFYAWNYGLVSALLDRISYKQSPQIFQSIVVGGLVLQIISGYASRTLAIINRSEQKRYLLEKLLATLEEKRQTEVKQAQEITCAA